MDGAVDPNALKTRRRGRVDVALGTRRATAAMLFTLALPGSTYLYQGEELGLTETDILFEDLTDPPGIRFWPEYKGRDGCRTPIPWEPGAAPNGFTTGTPWLPVKSPQAALNVAGQNAEPASTLGFYRQALAFRRAREVLASGGIEFLKAREPLLAFRRTGPDETLTCLYNLSPEPLTLSLTGGEVPEPLLAQSVVRRGRRLTLGANGFAIVSQAPGTMEFGIRFGGRSKKPAG
jgi:alpha-glucosidase